MNDLSIQERNRKDGARADGERLIVSAAHGCAVLRVAQTTTAAHAQWGVALLWGIEGDVSVEHADGTSRGRLVVVPAGVKHITRSGGPMLSIVLDADDHRAAAWSVGQRPWASEASGQRSEALRLFEHRRPPFELALAVAGAIFPTGARKLADSRIQAAVDTFANVDPGPSPLARLSQATGMTPAHVSTIFHRTMGISLRRWLLWRRVLRGLLALQPGRLAASAAAVGFADQAHLTRSMRRVVGYTPGFFARSI